MGRRSANALNTGFPMCISAQALALFLNIIVAPISSEAGVITVHAQERDVEWIAVADKWCTDAPQQEAAARLAEL